MTHKTNMETTYYFSVDLGATSGRTVLSSFNGERIVMKELTRFKNPIIPLGGHMYWDLPALYYEVLLGLRKVSEEKVLLKSIGIDTWGCDFACFGIDGQLLGLPYSYRDPHTDGAQKEFFEKMSPEDLYNKTGIQIMDFNSVFQLDTLMRNRASCLKNAHKILFMPDALIYMLTGEAVCEYTIASTSQMLNHSTGDLDESILAALGLGREKFGKMVKPGTVAGKLTSQVREFTGLGDVEVVAVAGHDTGSAVAAIPSSDDNYTFLSCGTWSLLGIELKKPVVTRDSFEANFTNEGGVEGTVRFLKNICGLWIFEQSRKEFKDKEYSVGELISLCRKEKINSLIDPDDPCFSHPLSMTAAIDAYCKRTGQTVPATPGEYCRVIFRSLALKYRQVVECLRNFSPEKISRLQVIGGGSQNEYLMQCAADALNMPVICGPVEGTALGNALMQIKSAGRVNSLSEMRSIVKSSVELKTFYPENTEEWSDVYQKFLEIQNK